VSKSTLEGFAPKDATWEIFMHMLLLDNEVQINKNNNATMLFMSHKSACQKIA